MVGRSGGTLGGRERIVIVDELLARRLKRAARRHVVRRPQVWRAALLLSLAFALALLLPDLAGAGPGHPSQAIPAAVGMVLAATGTMLGHTAWAVGKHYDREFVPGRLIGLTIGTQTIRYRDHDSCTEYAYSCVAGVVSLRDVVVVDLGQVFWSLPIELFDGVGLEVLRARAGRPALGNEPWPELQA
jgi:hypothetical protein